jgi:hypothetical protein
MILSNLRMQLLTINKGLLRLPTHSLDSDSQMSSKFSPQLIFLSVLMVCMQNQSFGECVHSSGLKITTPFLDAIDEVYSIYRNKETNS